MTRTDANRGLLDESDSTAVRCEHCRRWTLDAVPIYSGGESIDLCQSCAYLDDDSDRDPEPGNFPCVACGRDDLPLHYNRRCADCGIGEPEGGQS